MLKSHPKEPRKTKLEDPGFSTKDISIFEIQRESTDNYSSREMLMIEDLLDAEDVCTPTYVFRHGNTTIIGTHSRTSEGGRTCGTPHPVDTRNARVTNRFLFFGSNRKTNIVRAGLRRNEPEDPYETINHALLKMFRAKTDEHACKVEYTWSKRSNEALFIVNNARKQRCKEPYTYYYVRINRL